MKKVLFDNHEVILELENGIMLATFKVENLDLETTQKLVELRKKATNGKERPLIANIISVKSATKEARDFFASEKGCEGINATAIIVNSSIGTMIGNFYIVINKPLRPTKLFTDIIEAKKWLAQYVE